MNPSEDFPWAEEWGVTAAPFILNLQDSPAAEDFNGTSMVRRRSHGHSQALACLRVHVLLWPYYSPAIRPCTLRPLTCNLLRGRSQGPADDDCVVCSQVMPGYYQADYIEGWSIPADHPLPPSAKRQ